MSVTIHASDKRGHGLIGASGLHLKVGGFPLRAFVALELVGGSHLLDASFALKHRLRFDIGGLFFAVVAGHLVGCHGDNGFGFDSTQQDATPEVGVLIVFDVEHDGPAPRELVSPAP